MMVSNAGMPPKADCGPGVPGAVAAVGAIPLGMPGNYPAMRTSVKFVGPTDMSVSWYGPAMAPVELRVPGSYNFAQAAVYRLKLTNIPNRPELALYPTLEVVPANLKTCTFLAHSSVPVAFTDEDFEQVKAGNYVIKVVYLPDPQFQDVVTSGPNELVSSRLEPGADPIAEASRRGSILLIVRLGNINLELANSPAMDAPGPGYGAPGSGYGAPGSGYGAPGSGYGAPCVANPRPTGPAIGTAPPAPLPTPAGHVVPSGKVENLPPADTAPTMGPTMPATATEKAPREHKRWTLFGSS
jgi:hypothetical protein